MLPDPIRRFRLRAGVACSMRRGNWGLRPRWDGATSGRYTRRQVGNNRWKRRGRPASLRSFAHHLVTFHRQGWAGQ